MFLVKQAQRGDADAFVALIEKYKMDLYKVAKAYLKNEEDVADVMQETTLSAWEHLGEKNGKRNQNPDQQLQQCVKRTETLHCHERFFHAGRRAAGKDRCRIL